MFINIQKVFSPSNNEHTKAPFVKKHIAVASCLLCLTEWNQQAGSKNFNKKL